MDNEEKKAIAEAMKKATQDEALQAMRYDLAIYASEIFAKTGQLIHLTGHLLGEDRIKGESNTGHGSDEAVAISLLLRIGSQLVSAAANLLTGDQPYAGAALVRQLVEVEYLAWAFETQDAEAERWLRSSKEERMKFFTPAKLRKAADGRFRGQDYGHHCEMGGHPVPGSFVLLDEDSPLAQLLLGDMLGHTGRIWDHCVGWGAPHTHGGAIRNNAEEMSKRFNEWKSKDYLAQAPQPPN